MGLTRHQLDGKVVVLTGASAGVGRATARELAGRGARLALLARAGEGLEAARSEAAAAGTEAIAVATDVADPNQVEAAAERAEAELGPIDVWINDAMATIFARVWDIEPAEIRRATEVTYLGAVHGTISALRRMRPRDHGRIIQVGSALSYRGIPLQSAYCGAKHALRGFTDSLRCELLDERSKVGLTMVQLPGLNTPQFSWVRTRGIGRTPRPVPPVYEPEIAARGIVLAATSRRPRREVWVGGSTVGTIIGNKLAPWAADLYLGRTNVEAQQTDHPVLPDRRDYLFEPLPADRGAHGSFDDESKGRSLQLALNERRGRVLATVALGLGAGALAARGAILSRRDGQ